MYVNALQENWSKEAAVITKRTRFIRSPPTKRMYYVFHHISLYQFIYKIFLYPKIFTANVEKLQLPPSIRDLLPCKMYFSPIDHSLVIVKRGSPKARGGYKTTSH